MTASEATRDRIARVIFESDFPHMDWTDESESYRDEWRKNADALLVEFPWLADEPRQGPPGASSRSGAERIAALQAEVERQTAYAKNAVDQQGHLMRQHREARARAEAAEAAEAKLAAVRAFAQEQRDEIRTRYDLRGGAPAEYVGFANACDDVLAVIAGGDEA